MNPINEYILEDDRIQKAMRRIVDILLDAYKGNDNKWHFPTVIGAAAALTGELSLLACHSAPPKDDLFLVSDDVERFLGDGQRSLSIFDLIRLDTDISSLPYDNEDSLLASISQRTAGASGTENYPCLSSDTTVFPHEWSPNACPRFRLTVKELFDKLSLSAEERAWTMALATGELIGLSQGFSKNGMSAQPARSDILVRMAAEVTYACAHMMPLREEIAENPPESPLDPRVILDEKSNMKYRRREIAGKIVEFGFEHRTSWKFYHLRIDGKEYSVMAHEEYDRSRGFAHRHGEGIKLKDITPEEGQTSFIKDLFKTLILEYHMPNPEPFVIFYE